MLLKSNNINTHLLVHILEKTSIWLILTFFASWKESRKVRFYIFIYFLSHLLISRVVDGVVFSSTYAMRVWECSQYMQYAYHLSQNALNKTLIGSTLRRMEVGYVHVKGFLQVDILLTIPPLLLHVCHHFAKKTIM